MFGIIIFFGMVFSTVVGWDWIMWLKDNRFRVCLNCVATPTRPLLTRSDSAT